MYGLFLLSQMLTTKLNYSVNQAIKLWTQLIERKVGAEGFLDVSFKSSNQLQYYGWRDETTILKRRISRKDDNSSFLLALNERLRPRRPQPDS